MDIKSFIENHYGLTPTEVALIRKNGSEAYRIACGSEEYFFRVIGKAFANAATAAEIQSHLYSVGFDAPKVMRCENKKACAQSPDGRICVLYEYIRGVEADLSADATETGKLLGSLRDNMQNYVNQLPDLGYDHYIGRLIDMQTRTGYDNALLFREIGEAIWSKIKGLPRGFCHGDAYCGNFIKTDAGRLYLTDFDTSHIGFPMFDVMLACNLTDYFAFAKSDLLKSQETLARFLPCYREKAPLSEAEENAFVDFIALYHFTLQATIIEMHGIDCVDSAFFDKQLGWLESLFAAKA